LGDSTIRREVDDANIVPAPGKHYLALALEQARQVTLDN
jgi:hypothetical protein